ncbi:MAG: tRNA pseudouridine(38-40) synthase TruA [Actinomycetaceae bacterium]|nr:tRNA pseudouridine(38-40) synthase TruA [Actinomycetaceae bacterium]
MDDVDELVRVRLDLGYDGSRFHGWAAQPGLRTVQGILEEALATILRMPLTLTVAGRTDAGVHARGQVCHFDLPRAVWQGLDTKGQTDPGESLLRRLAGLLAREAKDQVYGASDVVVYRARVVPQVFDARFSALWRRYLYRIADTRAGFDPLRRHDTVWVPNAPALGLDVDAMNEAAARLVGEHDFLSFCKPREGASTIRTLQELSFTRAQDSVIHAHVQADAFCHSMVRSLMGACISVGRAQRDLDWIADLVERPRRCPEVNIAPANGLSLEEVAYPETEEALAAQQTTARTYRGPKGC